MTIIKLLQFFMLVSVATASPLRAQTTSPTDLPPDDASLGLTLSHAFSALNSDPAIASQVTVEDFEGIQRLNHSPCQGTPPYGLWEERYFSTNSVHAEPRSIRSRDVWVIGEDLSIRSYSYGVLSDDKTIKRLKASEDHSLDADSAGGEQAVFDEQSQRLSVTLSPSSEFPQDLVCTCISVEAPPSAETYPGEYSIDPWLICRQYTEFYTFRAFKYVGNQVSDLLTLAQSYKNARPAPARYSRD